MWCAYSFSMVPQAGRAVILKSKIVASLSLEKLRRDNIDKWRRAPVPTPALSKSGKRALAGLCTVSMLDTVSRWEKTRRISRMSRLEEQDTGPPCMSEALKGNETHSLSMWSWGTSSVDLMYASCTIHELMLLLVRTSHAQWLVLLHDCRNRANDQQSEVEPANARHVSTLLFLHFLRPCRASGSLEGATG